MKTYYIYDKHSSYITTVKAADMNNAWYVFRIKNPHAIRDNFDIVYIAPQKKSISWKLVLVEVIVILSIFFALFFIVTVSQNHKTYKMLTDTGHTYIVRNEDVYCVREYFWSYSFSAIKNGEAVNATVCTELFNGSSTITYR